MRHIRVRDREGITEQASIRELKLHKVINRFAPSNNERSAGGNKGSSNRRGEGGTCCDSVTVVENSQDSRAIRGTMPFVQCECSVIRICGLKKEGREWHSFLP